MAYRYSTYFTRCCICKIYDKDINGMRKDVFLVHEKAELFIKFKIHHKTVSLMKYYLISFIDAIQENYVHTQNNSVTLWDIEKNRMRCI